MYRRNLIYLVVSLLFVIGCRSSNNSDNSIIIKGELKVWHKVTMFIEGPETNEYDKNNPFLNYKVTVTFKNGNKQYTVPGFYAADGNASETSADAGNTWKVRFRPDDAGTWKYTVSFREGKNIAISNNDHAGVAIGPDGFTGEIEISGSDKTAPDLRALGRVEYTGERYLKFAGQDVYFLKNGADSPENFLAFSDFDQTYRFIGDGKKRDGEANPDDAIHQYAPHINDWSEGDPVWQESKGKGIIGAVNYLASKGINSVYMLTMNIQGDGNDVWPWNDYNERYRFDCSKLDQWEIVFDHMEKKGMMIHLVTQETENECLLDVGYTEVQRKLYYRELVARFGHHLAVTWNLGEENGYADWSPIGQTEKQKEDMASYLKAVNPYPNFNVLHTHSYDELQEAYLLPLLGFEDLDGLAFQEGDVKLVHEKIKRYINLSDDSGKAWVVSMDEIGWAHKGVMPDEVDPKHDTVRHHALWGALMAGAGGAEWYFGYKYAHNDLGCEDFRSRDLWWEQTTIATNFFQKHLPFYDMHSADHLINREDAYCFAKEGEVYAIYLPDAKSQSKIQLTGSDRDFEVKWFNPRENSGLETGSVEFISSKNKRADVGFPPNNPEKDWVCLIKKN